MANAVHIQDPFRPQLSPVHCLIDAPTRIDKVLREQGLIRGKGRKLKRTKPFVVVVNGDYVLQSDWSKRLSDKDLIITVPLPPHLQGGGKSNPLQVVLQLALVIAAPYVGVWAAGAMGFTAGTTAFSVASGLVSAGVMMAGSMLISAILPAPSMSSTSDTTAGNPAYLVGTQNNAARLRQPMPVLYGRRRFYPDLAAMPYAEINNNFAYLNQLFCLTQGRMQIEQICIEKTPIANYEEVEYQVVEPYADVTLFPDNAYSAPEVQDIELEGATENTSGATIIWYEKKPTPIYETIDGKLTVVGANVTYKPIYGDVKYKTYIATPQNCETTKISLDFSMPSGLAQIKDDGGVGSATIDFCVEVRKIDASNSPIGDWVKLNQTEYSDGVQTGGGFLSRTSIVKSCERFTGATLDAQLRTVSYAVPMGRYEVRVARYNTDSDSTRVSDALHWIGLRSYMPSVKNYGNCTMLAVRIKATNNLNSNIARRLNVLGTRILPVYDGAAWSEQPTRNPAWALSDVLRNVDYGRNITDKKINLSELVRLAGVWQSRGDYCDGLFIDETTVFEALNKVAEVGRTKPIYYAGVIDFVRNEPKLLTQSYMFTPNNMLKDTFSVQYVYPKASDADYITVEYTDATSWETKRVDCYIDEGQRNRALTIQMPFITSRQQAWREGIHRVAMNRVQREFPNFSTEMEGVLPKYGDKLLLSHDVPEWSQSGYLVGVNGSIIETSEYLDWVDGANHVMLIRGRDGRVQGSYVVSKVDDTHARIDGTPYLSSGDGDEPTHYVFGTVENVGLPAIMLSATPDQDQRVAITCVNYSDYPHTVENELTMPTEQVYDNEETETLVIAWIKVTDSIVKNVFNVSCNFVRDAQKYEFQVSSDGGATWAQIDETTSQSVTADLPFGEAIKIRARALGSYAGDWFVITTPIYDQTVVIDYAAPTMVITSSGGGDNDVSKSFNIRVTSNGLEEVENYSLEENGLIIWSGTLGVGQTASIDRSFNRHFDDFLGVYVDSFEVTYKSYGRDKNSILTYADIQTLSY